MVVVRLSDRGARRRPTTSALLCAVLAAAATLRLPPCGESFANLKAVSELRHPAGLRGAIVLRATDTDGGGEFDFGEYDAPTGVSISEAVDDEETILAPPEAEVFLTKETGEYECTNCNYVYKPLWGEGNYPPGTKFKDLPSNWRCPECRVSKDKFKPVVEEIAGFAENQEYGLGFNTMTAGQKSVLIWGSLTIVFVGLLSGYLLD